MSAFLTVWGSAGHSSWLVTQSGRGTVAGGMTPSLHTGAVALDHTKPASLWELWRWTSVCHLRFLVTMAVLAPWQKLFVRKKKRNTKWILLTHQNSTVLSGEDAGAQRPPVPHRQDNLIFQKRVRRYITFRLKVKGSQCSH